MVKPTCSFSDSKLMASNESIISNLSSNFSIFQTTKSLNTISLSPICSPNTKDVAVQTGRDLYIDYDSVNMDSKNMIQDENSFDSNEVYLDCLIDAARCMCAQIKIEQAEKILNDLLTKFATSYDLSTTFENLNSSNPTCDKNDSLNCQYNELSKNMDETQHSLEKPLFFSPIFKLLLNLPEAYIFPDLYQTTPLARKLNDLCNHLVFAIKRTKNKVCFNVNYHGFHI